MACALEEKAMRVGFIGLGRMGQGMVRNLLRAGHEVTVWNRTRAAAEALEASRAGGRSRLTIAGVARAATSGRTHVSRRM